MRISHPVSSWCFFFSRCFFFWESVLTSQNIEEPFAAKKGVYYLYRNTRREEDWLAIVHRWLRGLMSYLG